MYAYSSVPFRAAHWGSICQSTMFGAPMLPGRGARRPGVKSSNIIEQGRGGVRQRAARLAGTSSGASKSPSELAKLLLELWAWGHLSPQAVQKIAYAASTDIALFLDESDHGDGRMQQAKLEQVEKLARLGSSGRHSNNMHSELVRSLGGYKWARPSFVQLPLRCRPGIEDSALLSKHQVVLWPHEMMAAMWENYMGLFRDCVFPGAGVARKFWNEVDRTPWMARHPMRRVPNWKDIHIPITLHGDGVPVTGLGKTWSKSYTIYSWNSILGTGDTKHTNFYIWSVFGSVYPKESRHAFWRKLTASLTAMQEGVWPPGSPKAGQQLAGKLCIYLLSPATFMKTCTSMVV